MDCLTPQGIWLILLMHNFVRRTQQGRAKYCFRLSTRMTVLDPLSHNVEKLVSFGHISDFYGIFAACGIFQDCTFWIIDQPVGLFPDSSFDKNSQNNS